MSVVAYYQHRRAALQNKALRINVSKARVQNTAGLLALDTPFVFALRARRSVPASRTGYLFTAYTGASEQYAIIEGYGNGIEWGSGDFAVRATFGAVEDDLFHEYLVTHDGSTLRTFLDGTLVTELPGSPLPPAGTQSLVIGGTLAADGVDEWQGDFDFFLISKDGGQGLAPVLVWEFRDTLKDEVAGQLLQVNTAQVYVDVL